MNRLVGVPESEVQVLEADFTQLDLPSQGMEGAYQASPHPNH